MEFFDRYKDDMTTYVNELLSHYDPTNRREQMIGYSRFEHIMRVYKWVQKLYAAYPDKNKVDFEVLSIAAIFHDVGYCRSSEVSHAEVSSEICREYLLDKGYPLSKTESVCGVIARHSDKETINDDIPIELVLLLEADMLDDMGAMGLVIDVWMEAVCGENVSFRSILRHMEKYTLAEMQQENPMRTDEGKRIWEKKKALTEAFVKSYREDFSI